MDEPQTLMQVSTFPFPPKTFLSLFLSLFLLLASHPLFAQQKNLVSGPMLGDIAHREATIWLEVGPKVKTITLNYWATQRPSDVQTYIYKGVLGNLFNPIQIVLGGLEMNTDYSYQIVLDKKVQTLAYPLHFKTRELWEWRKPAPDFSFLTGSCSYFNDTIYDRPGKPYGNNPKIFETMADQKAAFMVWLGDDVYTREADYSSKSGINYRYSHDRATPELQRFLGSCAHYSIWDDHDYGPNNGNLSYRFKEYTRDLFTKYWANPSYGEANKGIYTTVQYGDCEFFMTDDRWFRWADELPDSINGKPNMEKLMLGTEQMVWLKNALAASTATFKFIVTGSQVLNPSSSYDCFRHYPSEYQALLDYIQGQNLKGVLFLTGDRHHSEVIKLERKGTYPLYDITASPLTSGVSGVLRSAEKDNPNRVPKTLVVAQNFARISVSGVKKDRQLKVEFVTADGVTQGEWVVKESELK
jgi:alkaline phosphatase D